MTIRVVVADDHEVVRSGLACLLEESDIDIVGEARDGAEAVKTTAKMKPDVVLMDIRMADHDGLSALQEIRENSPETQVVMLSTYDNPTYIARSVAMGASDYVLKGSPREKIVSAIRRAANGEPSPEGSMMDRVRQAMEQRGKRAEGIPLTGRELQVLRHLALGLSNKEIGSSLSISVETVKEHVQNILRKIKAVDRTQAAVWAVKQGLV